MTTDITWKRLRKLVKNRDKSICYYCGVFADNGHCDHKRPLSKGGTDEITNLVWSCAECNLKKGNHIIEIPNRKYMFLFELVSYSIRELIFYFPLTFRKTRQDRKDKNILLGIDKLCESFSTIECQGDTRGIEESEKELKEYIKKIRIERKEREIDTLPNIIVEGLISLTNNNSLSDEKIISLGGDISLFHSRDKPYIKKLFNKMHEMGLELKYDDNPVDYSSLPDWLK